MHFKCECACMCACISFLCELFNAHMIAAAQNTELCVTLSACRADNESQRLALFDAISRATKAQKETQDLLRQVQLLRQQLSKVRADQEQQRQAIKADAQHTVTLRTQAEDLAAQLKDVATALEDSKRREQLQQNTLAAARKEGAIEIAQLKRQVRAIYPQSCTHICVLMIKGGTRYWSSVYTCAARCTIAYPSNRLDHGATETKNQCTAN